MSATPCLHCVNLQMSTIHSPAATQSGTAYEGTDYNTLLVVVQYGTAYKSIDYNTLPEAAQ